MGLCSALSLCQGRIYTSSVDLHAPRCAGLSALRYLAAVLSICICLYPILTVPWSREDVQVQQDFRHAGVPLPHSVSGIQFSSLRDPNRFSWPLLFKATGKIKSAILTGLGKNFPCKRRHDLRFKWMKRLVFKILSQCSLLDPWMLKGLLWGMPDFPDRPIGDAVSIGD